MPHRISICFLTHIHPAAMYRKLRSLEADDKPSNLAQIVNKLCEFSTNDRIITENKWGRKQKHMHIL